jgi:hypothetical protein
MPTGKKTLTVDELKRSNRLYIDLTHRSALWISALLLPISLGGCGTETPVIPPYAEWVDLVCEPTEESVHAPPSESNGKLGFSVAVATWGTSEAGMNSYRSVVSGRPAVGDVRVSDANPYTGLLDPASGTLNQTLFPPAGPPIERNLGYAVYAADIRDCDASNACGEEILVGAPDLSGVEKGLLLWYKASAGTGNFVHGGTVGPPPAFPNGAQFGSSIASYSNILDEDEPWVVNPDVPPWIAVGAPGADKVEIYTVSSSSATPLVAAQTLSSPDSGRQFGHAVVAGDFNDDGYADLAVGAPEPAGEALEGRVYVYLGASSGPTWFPLPPLVLDGFPLTGTSTGGVQEDGFGWALDAGPFTGGQWVTRSSLVVGAPFNSYVDETEDDEYQGAVCTFVLATDGEGPSGLIVVSPLCFANPWNDVRTVTDENFGQAVSVGNYVNQDKNGLMDTDKARLQEVAVGTPGFDGNRGVVGVFVTDANGLHITSLNTLVYEYPGETAGAHFGESLAGGYIQETGWEDLAIGAPDHPTGAAHDGRTTLTKAMPPADCPTIYGIWDVQDTSPYTKRVQLQPDTDGNTRLLFLDDFATEILDEDDVLCHASGFGVDADLAFDLPRGLVIVLDGPWDCEESTMTWVDVPANDLIDLIAATMGVDTESEGWSAVAWALGDQYMDVKLTLDAEAFPHELEIDINTDDMSWDDLNSWLSTDETCRLAHPWMGTMSASRVCED